MAVILKPIHEHVVVATGASSGIGLATAREAARRGAKLVLVSPSADALEALAAEIGRDGGEAFAFAAVGATWWIARERAGGTLASWRRRSMPRLLRA